MENEQHEKTEMDLTLSELPPVGTHAGVFVDAFYGTRTDKKNRTNKTLTLVIELDKQRSDQTRFTVNSRYVLNIKGEKKLRQPARGFDQTLSAEALKKFNANKVFVGKACLATVGYATEDGRTVARANQTLITCGIWTPPRDLPRRSLVSAVSSGTPAARGPGLPSRQAPLCLLNSLTCGQDGTEPEVGVAAGRAVVVAVGRPTDDRVGVPTAAALHAVRA